MQAIVTDDGFPNSGIFQVGPGLKQQHLEDFFRYEALKMLRAGGDTDAVIESMLSWRHSSFNVYCGPAIWPHDEGTLENLAHYITRAAVSHERMTYIAEHESSIL